MNAHAGVNATQTAQIVARVERIPYSAWHRKVRAIVGIATFFDGLDLLAIAYVVPVIGPLWHLSHPQIGFLFSAGYIGMFIGAYLFGWVAERYGRINALTWSIAIYAIMSFACASAWGYWSFFAFRLLQGIGMGGEVPVAAAYISEVSKAKGRGRSILYYQLAFSFGIAICSLAAVWIVPHLGWRYLFVLGGLPAILTIFLRKFIPESPRWLAMRGRLAEAEDSVTLIETETVKALQKPLPPPQAVETDVRKATWRDLFGDRYLRRTTSIWLAWFATALINQGVAVWMPTIYKTVFHLDLGTVLKFGVVTSVIGFCGTIVCTLVIDSVSRRTLFATIFTVVGTGMLLLAFLKPSAAIVVLMFVSTCHFFIVFSSHGLYCYTPELYPTRARAFATAMASSWGRVATIVGPSLIGLFLDRWGWSSIFLAFGTISLITMCAISAMMVDTKGRVLEEVSR